VDNIRSCFLCGKGIRKAERPRNYLSIWCDYPVLLVSHSSCPTRSLSTLTPCTPFYDDPSHASPCLHSCAAFVSDHSSLFSSPSLLSLFQIQYPPSRSHLLDLPSRSSSNPHPLPHISLLSSRPLLLRTPAMCTSGTLSPFFSPVLLSRSSRLPSPHPNSAISIYALLRFSNDVFPACSYSPAYLTSHPSLILFSLYTFPVNLYTLGTNMSIEQT
jgi:hypothetical protein